MKNALNNQVGMLGDEFLWLVANLKQGVIYFVKQEGGNHCMSVCQYRMRPKKTISFFTSNAHTYCKCSISSWVAFKSLISYFYVFL